MANRVLPITDVNQDDILRRVEAADFKNSDISDDKTFVAAGVLFGIERSLDDNFFNLFAQRTFDAMMEHYGDVAADGYTDRHVAEASAILYHQLSRLYSRQGAGFILKRIPLRIYMNGLHSSSNKSTQIGEYDEDIFGDANAISQRLTAAGVNPAKAAELTHTMLQYIPYDCFSTAVNMLAGKISKRMIIRIMVIKMKTIHDTHQNSIHKNILRFSMEKYGVDVSETSLTEPWLFFGASLHPQFPAAERKEFAELTAEIFKRAKEQKGATTPFKPL